MSTPTSVPITPPQPNKPQYNVSELYLFHSYTRTSYLATSGEQSAPYDSKRKSKDWFDSTQTGKDGTVTYNVILNGQTQVTQITMSCTEAATLNLQGPYQYPAFVPPSAQTTAVQGLPGTQPTMINAALICEEADAVAISQEFGFPAPVDDSANQWPDPVDWRGETRRPWAITVNGVKYMCSELIVIRNKGGIGAPGTLKLDAPGGPKFIPAPEPDWGNLEAMPSPVRPLLPNEKLILWGVIGSTMVERTDLQPAPTNTTPITTVVANPALTDQQAAQLQTIFEWVQRQPQ